MDQQLTPRPDSMDFKESTPAPPNDTALAKTRRARLTPTQLQAVERVCHLIDAESDGDGPRQTLASLAEAVGLSPWHLQRLFKKALGVSPRDYAAARRAERFRAELRDHGRVAEATYGAGYGSSSRVYENADRTLGMTPATYAKGGAGARIVYSLADSPLGRLLAAATERGLCFLALGDDDTTLEAELRAEFPTADSIERDDPAIQDSLEVLMAYLAGATPHLDLPLDVRATAFQRRVWSELIAIPYGETRTYREIAELLGRPNAWRAVGRACAINPVSLVIPCHRALREDGNLAGYRWGVTRKAELLTREAQGESI
ncbi:methylated-DNA--[protein]-cysteine S-methyltransferase [Algihabitans albus]|uniref:methylated-DNA--[protein]-cysteine S-methyltransferase n=1 Tax=Algihabitans albus TaxID=2164067 RepID=UPI000E5C89BA|nr:methylated-DNA--[protein]-cysteine S-methyltransferase [Algihabitans albus]